MIPYTSEKKEYEKLSNTIMRYTSHNELLHIYRNNKTTPKGLQLKFHLAACVHDKKLLNETSHILQRTSLRLQNAIIEANTRHINHCQSKLVQVEENLNSALHAQELSTFKESIKTKLNSLKTSIKIRHQKKFTRDNINITINTKKCRRYKKDKRKHKFQEIKKRKKQAKQQRIIDAIQNTPNQDPINLSSQPLTSAQSSLLKKGPTYVPSPGDANWYQIRRDFDKWVNKLRFSANQDSESSPADAPTPLSTNSSNPPFKPVSDGPNNRSQPTKHHALEAFISAVERQLFDPVNIQRTTHNLRREEQLAMREIQGWSDRTVRLQDKGGRFVVLNNTDYIQKVTDQIERSHLATTETDLSSEFEEQVKTWSEKWTALRKLPKDWASYVLPSNPKPGTMYGLIKTHKPNNTNPARNISSGCGTAVEYLSIFVEKHLSPIAEELPHRVKDKEHMLKIIDNLNNSNLPPNAIIASLDVVNMFPNIDNVKGVSDTTIKLEQRARKDPPTRCIIEALLLCLQCNNTNFCDKNYLQVDGTAQGPHMACSYSDIAMARYDQGAMSYSIPPHTWYRYRDDVFLIWTNTVEELLKFVEYLNTLDDTGKLQLVLTIADEHGLDYLELNMIFDPSTCKISTDIYAKPTNTFTYVDANTCYQKRNINNIPYGVALRIRRICDTDEKYQKRALEYSNYLIARNYDAKLVDEAFKKVCSMSRDEARRPKTRQPLNMKHALITNFNPTTPHFQKIIKNSIHILHSDPEMKIKFPPGSIKTIYRRNHNLKEILSPSRFPKIRQKEKFIADYCNRCDICLNYVNPQSTIRCTATGNIYRICGTVSCWARYVIYCITCKKCLEQYVGSTDNYKPRMRVHKSDNNLNNVRCGVASHFNGQCKHPDLGPNGNMSVQILEVMPPHCRNDEYLLRREKYWQAQLFTITHGMNSYEDWYSNKRKGYRK